jgi:hypothetical protein
MYQITAAEATYYTLTAFLAVAVTFLGLETRGKNRE